MHKLRSALLSTCLSCALAGLPTTPAAAAGNIQLPEMGEPADQALSPEEEQQIGRQFMRRARNQLDLLNDAQIAHYIQQLGERLLTGGLARQQNYHFFVLRDPSLNAFATPGGYIGLHSGLILAAENESQLAGVLAHEIAHVEQRHIARALAESSNSGLITVAGILAAILVSQNNPQAGQAALATGIAASQQAQINFTRSHEAEADRIGIGILAGADFAAEGMAGFFAIMAGQAGLNSDESYPFLRTHPLSRERLDEAQARAESLSGTTANGSPPLIDSLEFQLMRARLRVLSSDNLPALQRQLQAELREQDSAAIRYALALSAQRLRQSQRASTLGTELLQQHPHSLPIRLLLAELDSDNTASDTAVARLAELSSLYPHYYPAVELQARALATRGDGLQAEAAIQSYLRNQPQPAAEAWQLLAEIRLNNQRPAHSAEALAEYYLSIDEPGEALSQLRHALRNAPPNSPLKTRAEARLRDIEAATGQRRSRDQAADDS